MICLDTGPLIAAVQPELTTPQKLEWRRRLRPYLELQAAGQRILIPSVVLAEYLYGLPQAEWQAQSAAIIAGNFFVAPLSHQAAIKAADNRRKLVGGQHEKEVARGLGGNEVKFKADLFVVAIAITFKATLLITGDGGLHRASKQLGLRSITAMNYRSRSANPVCPACRADVARKTAWQAEA